LLQDTSERLTDIRRLVSTLDIPVRQVLIEARIVIVSDDFSVSWAFASAADCVDHGGSDGGDRWRQRFVNEDDDYILTRASPAQGYSGFVQGDPSDRYMVNLPWPMLPATRVDTAGSDYLVDLELSAAQAEGRGEIISAPAD